MEKKKREKTRSGGQFLVEEWESEVASGEENNEGLFSLWGRRNMSND